MKENAKKNSPHQDTPAQTQQSQDNIDRQDRSSRMGEESARKSPRERLQPQQGQPQQGQPQQGDPSRDD